MIELDPPRVLPRGANTRRPPVHSLGSIEKHQFTRASWKVLMKPAGIWMNGCQSRGPASSTATVVPGSSLNRLASTEPADPAPTIT